jgi:hypothetical protein
MSATRDEYYFWIGSSYPKYPYVRIRRYHWGKVYPTAVRKGLLRTRQETCAAIRKGWRLELDTPRSEWTADQWTDYVDWCKILGDRRVFRQPNITVEIGYESSPFFFGLFRLGSTGQNLAECIKSLGDFIKGLLQKLPPEGVEKHGIIFTDLNSIETRIYWLGVILYAFRAIRLGRKQL